MSGYPEAVKVASLARTQKYPISGPVTIWKSGQREIRDAMIGDGDFPYDYGSLNLRDLTRLNKIFSDKGFRGKQIREIGELVSEDVVFLFEPTFRSQQWYAGLGFNVLKNHLIVLFPWEPQGVPERPVNAYSDAPLPKSVVEGFLGRLVCEAERMA